MGPEAQGSDTVKERICRRLSENTLEKSHYCHHSIPSQWPPGARPASLCKRGLRTSPREERDSQGQEAAGSRERLLCGLITHVTRAACLGLNLGSTTYQLCDTGPVT